MKHSRRIFFRALYLSGAFALTWECIARPLCGALGGPDLPSLGAALPALLPALLGAGL